MPTSTGWTWCCVGAIRRRTARASAARLPVSTSSAPRPSSSWSVGKGGSSPSRSRGRRRRRDQMLPKDHAENVMIVDLMRNDLSGVCEPGTVGVDALCAFEEHPGLVHLVSTVSGRLRDGVAWRDVFAAAYPPGSVSGAPKSSALTAIGDLEASPRGPYCGAVGLGRRRHRRGRARRRHPHVLGGAGRRQVGAGCGSGRAPASRGTPIPRPSGPRPSSRRPDWSGSPPAL